jgi:hypothetical protein
MTKPMRWPKSRALEKSFEFAVALGTAAATRGAGCGTEVEALNTGIRIRRRRREWGSSGNEQLQTGLQRHMKHEQGGLFA